MKEIFVTCAAELEYLLIDELKKLGITAKKGSCGVYIPQEMRNVYAVNYCSRIATRVLWPLSHFRCRDRHDLYREAKNIDWQKYIPAGKTIAIDSNVSHPNLRNSHFAALVVKDAICDQLREKTGVRPNVDIAAPDVQFNLFIQNGYATINLDTSGMPLYKRGYRQESGIAPLQESLAAAILQISSYSAEDTLCAPFCGSGTFLIEAAMMATNTPSGYFRKSWGFIYLPEFSETEWQKFKQRMDGQIGTLAKGKIFGCDSDPRAVEICRKHLKQAGFDIDVFHQEVINHRPDLQPTLIVANPPYGKRLKANLQPYRDLGVFLKSRSNFRAAILSPDSESMRAVGLPIKKSYPLSNGGLDVRLSILAI